MRIGGIWHRFARLDKEVPAHYEARVAEFEKKRPDRVAQLIQQELGNAVDQDTILQKIMDRRRIEKDRQSSAINAGLLLSSGFIAGESLMAVLIAFWVIGTSTGYLPEMVTYAENPWLALLIFPFLLYLLVRIPLNAAEKGGTPGVRVD